MKHDDMLPFMLDSMNVLCSIPSISEVANRFCQPADVGDVMKKRFGDVSPLDCAKEVSVELRMDGSEEFTIRGTLPSEAMKAEAHYKKCRGELFPRMWPSNIPQVKEVFFNGRATTIEWKDGTKTTVRAQDGVEFDEYAGICACLAKKAWGSSRVVKNLLKSDKIHRQKGKKKTKKGGGENGANS